MYAIHFQNIRPGHQKWYYMAIRFNQEKEWVVTSGWGKIGYSIGPANQKHQNAKEDGSKFASAEDALPFLMGAIDKRLKNNYTIVYCTPRLLGKLLVDLAATSTNNPYDGVITDWNGMYRRGHNAPVDHAPQWFKEAVTAKGATAVATAKEEKPDIAELFKAAPKKAITDPVTGRKIDKLTAKARAMTEDEEEDGDCGACDGKGWVKNRLGKPKRCSLCNTPGTVEGSDEDDKPRSRRSKRLKEKQESGNEPNIKRAPAAGSIRRLFNFHA